MIGRGSLIGSAYSVYGQRIRRRVVVAAVSLLVLAMSLHLIVVDRKTSILRDDWGPFTVRRYPLPRENESQLVVTRRGRWFIDVDGVDSGKDRACVLFLGIGPWRIDPEQLSEIVP